MTDAQTHIYAFTSCHGDAYFGSYAELKDRAVIDPVSVVTLKSLRYRHGSYLWVPSSQ